MNKYTTSAALLLSLVLPGLAAAQPLPPGLERLQTVMRTLDVDSDQALSTDEVQAATQRLLSLDIDGDGALSLEEMGGPAPIRGMIRQQYVLRALDEDGDLSVSADELARASRSLAYLDRDGDWNLSHEELNPPGPPGAPPPDDDGPGETPDDGYGAGGPPPGGAAPYGQPPGGPPPGGAPDAGGPGAANFANMDMMRRMNGYESEIVGDILPGADDRAFEGYTLVHDGAFGGQNANRIYLTDMNGETVHRWEPERYQPEGSVAYLLENGLLLRTVSSHHWLRSGNYPVGAAGTVQLLDWDSNVVWEYQMDVPGKHVFHHDVDYMPNGNILAIAYTGFSPEEARSMGWDGVFPANADTIWFDKVVELKPNLDDGSTEIVWQWNSWDHFVQDKYPDRANYGDVESAVGKIDVNYLREGYVLFLRGQMHHVNSVDYNPELDQIVLSSAAYGELWFIDHSTTMAEAAGDSGGRYGRGGDLIYRWGNPFTTRSGTLDDATLYWQHDARWITEGLPGAGNLLVYNNGTNRSLDGTFDPGLGMDFENSYTDLLEVRLPARADGSYDIGREPELVWSWNLDASEDYFSPFMSGWDRMPNGNTIFVNGHNKQVMEVTPAGERVLDYLVPENGRKYRVYKYPVDYPGLAGRF
ncbi:MAG: aryl-sulfate sulfotransferase [Rhodospirillaceae bacterium]|nr:aryl-sulfate sulfotransferase [Rhodospirillaceae bacterium]